jgi:hypothetical protein
VLDQLAALLKVGADLDNLCDVEVEGNENRLRERMSHSTNLAIYQTGGEEELSTLAVAEVMGRNGDEEGSVEELDREVRAWGEDGKGMLRV